MLIYITLGLAAAQAGMGPQRTTARQWNRPAVAGPLFREAPSGTLPFDPALFGRGVAAGDLDHDGRVDLLIATAGGAVLYANRGATGFVDETAQRLPVGLAGASRPLIGDVDGDGWEDLVLIADSVPDADVWLRGGGAGFYSAPTPLPLAAAVTSDAELVDIDGDGDLDLVRAIGSSGHSNSAGRDSLLLNDGAGNFTSSPGFESAPWNSETVASTGVLALDANLDGLLDLLFTRADSGAATGSPGAYNLLLLGTASGSFLDGSSALPVLKDNSYDAVALDLEGDGDLDLVVANSVLGVSGPNSGDVLVNQGGAQGGRAGLFLDRVGSIEETPSIAESIRLAPLAADVDLDGRQDVVFLVHDLPPGGEQPLFMGAGLDFRQGVEIGTGTMIAGGGAFADIDGDGDPDFVVAASGSAAGGTSQGRLRLFLNTSR